MQSVIELISTYSEINSSIINKKTFEFSIEFRRATDILIELKEKLIDLEIDGRNQQEPKNNLWSYFYKESKKEDSDEREIKAFLKKLPRVEYNPSNEQKIN